MSDYPNRAIRRRTTSRARQLSLDAQALERRLRKRYKGAEKLLAEMATITARSKWVAEYLQMELNLSRTVR